MYRQILTVAMHKDSIQKVEPSLAENESDSQLKSQILNLEDMIPSSVDIQPNETDGLNKPLYAVVTDKDKVGWAVGITPRVSHIAESD